MIIVLSILLIISGIFTFLICPQVGTLNLLVGLLVFVTTISTFLATALINPGIVMASAQIKSKGDFNASLEKICTDCNVFRSDFTEHCKKCRVCIEEYDDHYALLGKCVGKNTIKCFYAFLLSTLCLLIFIVTTLFFRFKDKF